MRSLGEFFGHIAQGVKSNPRPRMDANDKKTIRTTVEEKQEGNVILRRTTIEEVEIDRKSIDTSQHPQ